MRQLSSMETNLYTVKLYDVLYNLQEDSDIQYFFLVMDYVNLDLSNLLEKKPDNFDQNHFHTLVYNLICAVHFMHSAGIVHRDLKPNNILFTDNCKIVICDFGQARSITSEEI